ncbi:MAG: hypothetical protein AAGA32_08595 [Pseudomonadota bacterium]
MGRVLIGLLCLPLLSGCFLTVGSSTDIGPVQVGLGQTIALPLPLPQRAPPAPEGNDQVEDALASGATVVIR